MTHKNQAQDKKQDKKASQNTPQPKPEKPAQPAPDNTVSERIKALEKEAADMKDKYVRTYAEMENVKKRCQMEIQQRSKVAIGDFALDVLPVADNLARALDAPIPDDLKNNEFMKNLILGLQMTQKSLTHALEQNGVHPIESLNRPFDPNTQKAIQQIEDDSVPDGTVVQEWQKGYRIGDDRIFLEAMLIVSKKSN